MLSHNLHLSLILKSLTVYQIKMLHHTSQNMSLFMNLNNIKILFYLKISTITVYQELKEFIAFSFM